MSTLSAPAPSTTIVRLKRKRNEDPLPTLCTPSPARLSLSRSIWLTSLDLGLGPDTSASSSFSVASPLTPAHDTIKRTKLDTAPPPSMFTLALTVDHEDDPSIDTLKAHDLCKTQHPLLDDTRPASSDSADSTTSKKRAFSSLLVDPPKFRMSRKKARQHPPNEVAEQDYVVFDAVRELPLQSDVDENGVPLIRSSGLPDHVWGESARDVAMQDMLQSYLTVDNQNRNYINVKDEYVYDIYYRTAVSPATVPTDSNFGVLVYDSEQELVDDEEEVVDDEDADSNSEGYYQNSYPDEDEWAGEGWGSEDEDEAYGRRRVKGVVGFESDELEFEEDSGEDLYSYPEDD
jgi:Transcription factor Iwr1